MRDVPLSTRRPHWTEEEFQSWLTKQGKAEHLPVPLKKQPESKYRNQKVATEEGTFDSKREYARWNELKLMQQAGLISALEHHKRIPLEVNGKPICDYIADFVYYENGAEVWEDFKGMQTDVFRLKKKLIHAVYGKEVKITKARG